ncbi:MAG TPA: response regulator [Terracidiphilus sp.]|nr:response regulator [Terracidiphilus sp.]
MPSDATSMRVLVVDDEHIVADSLARILRGRGLNARAVYCGEDAAEIAIQWQPDAVISDVVMGKMDGVALAIFLSQSLPACRVLLISGNAATERLIDESKRLGHDFPILAKPFRPESIFEFFDLSGVVGSA